MQAADTVIFQHIRVRLTTRKMKVNENNHRRKKLLTVHPLTALECLSKHDQTQLQARGLHDYGAPMVPFTGHSTKPICAVLLQNEHTETDLLL